MPLFWGINLNGGIRMIHTERVRLSRAATNLVRVYIVAALTVVAALGYICWNASRVPEQYREFGLKVDGKWFAKNQSGTVEVPLTDDGWGEAETWMNANRYTYFVEKANGKFDK